MRKECEHEKFILSYVETKSCVRMEDLCEMLSANFHPEELAHCQTVFTALFKKRKTLMAFFLNGEPWVKKGTMTEEQLDQFEEYMKEDRLEMYMEYVNDILKDEVEISTTDLVMMISEETGMPIKDISTGVTMLVEDRRMYRLYEKNNTVYLSHGTTTDQELKQLYRKAKERAKRELTSLIKDLEDADA